MKLIDSIELDVLEEFGDIDLAEQAGAMMRCTFDTVAGMFAEVCGFGPSFVAQLNAALST